MTEQPPATQSLPELKLLGRLVEASNATFLVADEVGRKFVYKPVAGEAPLWDFPQHTLGRREVAAFELSRAAGFDCVPTTTWLHDGPAGPGSLQHWVEADGGDLADLVGVDDVPHDWYGIVVGVDADDHDVALVHAEHPGLRRLALFDCVANNADRKAGHVIRVGDRAYGVDHGVSFHVENKLRTILWGWMGEPFTDPERDLLSRVVTDAAPALEPWISAEEVDATMDRATTLLAEGAFPEPGDAWPVIPWPPI